MRGDTSSSAWICIWQNGTKYIILVHVLEPGIIYKFQSMSNFRICFSLGTSRSVRPLSAASERKVEDTLRKMIEYYRYHGVNLRTCYEDFDVHHIGKITESQVLIWFSMNFAVLVIWTLLTCEVFQSGKLFKNLFESSFRISLLIFVHLNTVSAMWMNTLYISSVIDYFLFIYCSSIGHSQDLLT